MKAFWKDLWHRYAIGYYLPKNLNLYYLTGSLALFILLNQVLSGIWLTFFYTPTAQDAFQSVQFILRDIHYGWLFRYLHTTGASLLFVVIYLHLFRGLLYGSYQKPRVGVWILGMMLYIALIMEAFLGYLLPWGQLSYWGAQVVTALISVVPYIGEVGMTWIRGDTVISEVTLHRFFALHVIVIPLLLLVLVISHLIVLRRMGSNNPEGIDVLTPREKIPFHPYYTLTDLLGLVGFLMVFLSIVFYCPQMGGYFLDPMNSVPADPLVTPDTIRPLWYMAPFYAILRAVPSKTWGLILMLSAMGFLFFMPWLDKSPVRSMRYKGKYAKGLLGLWVVAFMMLGILGVQDLTAGRLILTRFFLGIYFAYFLLHPWISRYESCLRPPTEIA